MRDCLFLTEMAEKDYKVVTVQELQSLGEGLFISYTPQVGQSYGWFAQFQSLGEGLFISYSITS